MGKVRRKFDQSTIRDAAKRLAAAAPGSEIVLFGSYARGNAGPNSDLDFLVIEPEKVPAVEEYVRLRLALRPLKVWVDLIVTSREEYERRRMIPSTLFYWADREGIRLNDAA